MLQIYKTSDASVKPALFMLVYGEGGAGKSTFSSTAPKPLMADCEGGSKYFGLRGISMDVAKIDAWEDMRAFYEHAQAEKYQTIVIDPIGELMSKLKRRMIATNDRKLVQNDGTPSMAGWGWLKETMRAYLKLLRDSGMNVLIVAHVDEQRDEDRMVKRPLIETKLWGEIVNMVDVVGYMTLVMDSEGNGKRVIMIDPSSDKFVAKDRTGQLGKVIEPDFSKIVAAVQGTETYKWSSEEAKKKEIPKRAEPETTQAKTMREALEKAKMV